MPPGEWVGWFSGERVKGPAVVTRHYALNEIPLFVRAGAIVPMQGKVRHAHASPVEPLVLTVFPGPPGATRVYEDRRRQSRVPARRVLLYARALFSPRRSFRARGDRVSQGRYPGMPSARGHAVRFRGVWPPKNVVADGKTVPYRPDGAAPGWRYEGETLTAVVSLPRSPLSRAVVVQLEFADALRSELLDGFAGRRFGVERAVSMLSALWPQDAAPESVVRLVQTGRRLGLAPENARKELETFARELPEVPAKVRKLRGAPATISAAAAQLEEQRPVSAK